MALSKQYDSALCYFISHTISHQAIFQHTTQNQCLYDVRQTVLPGITILEIIV